MNDFTYRVYYSFAERTKLEQATTSEKRPEVLERDLRDFPWHLAKLLKDGEAVEEDASVRTASSICVTVRSPLFCAELVNSAIVHFYQIKSVSYADFLGLLRTAAEGFWRRGRDSNPR